MLRDMSITAGVSLCIHSQDRWFVDSIDFPPLLWFVLSPRILNFIHFLLSCVHTGCLFPATAVSFHGFCIENILHFWANCQIHEWWAVYWISSFAKWVTVIAFLQVSLQASMENMALLHLYPVLQMEFYNMEPGPIRLRWSVIIAWQEPVVDKEPTRLGSLHPFQIIFIHTCQIFYSI